MSNNAKSALGTTLSWEGNVVSDISKIGGIEVSADPQEVTNLSSAYKEYIAGMPDGGEVEIEGYLYAGDTNGQIALKNAVGGAVGAVVISFPSAFGASWGFNALVTKFSTGDIEAEGGLSFTVSLKITGVPSLNVTASAGLTTPFLALSGSGTLIPSAAQATTEYVYSVLTGVSSITITPTASAGTITVNGNTVVSGQASSAVALGSAGSVTTITVVVTETGKIPKTYTIKVARA
jgi:hypothetical protein